MYENEISQLEQQLEAIKQNMLKDDADILALKQELVKLEQQLAESHAKHLEWLEQQAKLNQEWEEKQKELEENSKNLNQWDQEKLEENTKKLNAIKKDDSPNTFLYVGLAVLTGYLLTRKK